MTREEILLIVAARRREELERRALVEAEKRKWADRIEKKYREITAKVDRLMDLLAVFSGLEIEGQRGVSVLSVAMTDRINAPSPEVDNSAESFNGYPEEARKFRIGVGYGPDAVHSIVVIRLSWKRPTVFQIACYDVLVKDYADGEFQDVDLLVGWIAKALGPYLVLDPENPPELPPRQTDVPIRNLDL